MIDEKTKRISRLQTKKPTDKQIMRQKSNGKKSNGRKSNGKMAKRIMMKRQWQKEQWQKETFSHPPFIITKEQ